MEKIELNLLKDKKVQRELIDSLMKKGYSREQATEKVKPYNAGKAFGERLITAVGVAYLGGVYGAVGGAAAGNPLIGMGIGAGVGAIAGATLPAGEKDRALNVVRVSYGDKNNKVTNKTLQDNLTKKGYNAMKDYNDRRAYGDKAKQAIIVFDSKNNVTNTKITEVKSKDYGKAYARNYLKEHPDSKLEFNDLVKDGEAKYKQLYESGVIARARDAENKRLLEEAKNKK